MSYSSPDFTKESNSYIMSQYEQNAIAAAEAATARLAGATGGREWIPDKPQPESPLHNLSRMHQAMIRAMEAEATAAIAATLKDGESSSATSFATDFSDYAKILGECMERALAEHVSMREQHHSIEEVFRTTLKTQNSVLANRRTIGAWDMVEQEDMRQEIAELQEQLKNIEERLGIFLEKPGFSLPALQADLEQKIFLKQTEEQRNHYTKIALGLGSCL